MTAILATSGMSETRTYDRYGLYGVGHPAGAHLVGNPPDYEDMVWRRIAEAGGTSSRQAASWREIEAKKGKYDWSQLEGTLQYCREYPQIRPYILVVNTPGWAREDGQPSHLPPMESALPDWQSFCTELAKRYKGFVRHYEIWNEQNGFGWEAPPFHQIDKYLPLFKAAYEGLKAGDPDCIVSLGGLDNAGGYSPIEAKGYYDFRHKRTFGELQWEAFGDHPYGDAKSMMEKLRNIKGIAAGYGDGGVELWLTEWGFEKSGMSEEVRVKAITDYMTTLILDPEFEYVTESNYLCVADFETGARFGLCDANLRPRPAFYAYQRLPRPGQIVISDIGVRNESPTSAVVTWNTDTEATATLEYGISESRYTKSAVCAQSERRYSVTLKSLRPDTTYRFKVTAKATGLPDRSSLDYEFTTVPRRGLGNASFEAGFAVGIAKHWECLGENLCWDSARLPSELRRARSGEHSQAIVSYENGKSMDDYVVGQASSSIGRTVTFSAWSCVVTPDQTGRLVGRVGIDPTGGKDPVSDSVVWSPDRDMSDEWEKQSVGAIAAGSVVTVFVHGKTTQSHDGRAYFYVDDAEVEVK